MKRIVHFELEILYKTTYKAACGARTGELSVDESHVTCQSCLRKMGYQL